MESLLIIKIGGILLNNNDAVKRLFKELSRHKRLTRQKVIFVNGAASFGHELFNRVNGLDADKNFLSVTQLNTKKILYSVLPNLVNIRLLAWSRKYNIFGQGCLLSDFFSKLIDSCFDIDITRSFLKKNELPILKYSELIKALLKKHITPFICSLGIDTKGNIFHIDSDIVAAILAIIFNCRLIFLTDVSAVLNNKGQCIKTISSKQINNLICSGVVSNGMITKVQAASVVLRLLKKSVEIASWHNINNIADLFQGKSSGTRVIE
ncbi:hypothetical protein [Buchnera aphidicola]|uniref:amino acid kinase family protein n=1 Tax=Buchnera aphidicola TaxID=9 RepID=UPI00094DA051|nr:hypothetical protein [Buchnera aphidicola]